MTVYGLERIREYLGGFSSNYVIIGGSATNMNLEDGLLEGRTTHDVNFPMVRRSIISDFLFASTLDDSVRFIVAMYLSD